MFKLKPIPSTIPLPIREEWDRLQKVISEFSPANGQEEQVYQILERKLKLRDVAVDQVDDVGGIYGFCDMLRTICCKSIAVS